MASLAVMYVEDAIKEFARRQGEADDALGVILRSDDWGRKFIDSLNVSVSAGRPLSTRQGEFFITLVKRHRDRIVSGGCGWSGLDLDKIILSPSYRQEPYESVRVETEVRFLGDNKLGFRFKKDDDIKEAIKRIRQSIKHELNWSADLEPSYQFKQRMWVIPVTSSNYRQVWNMIARFGFAFDDEVAGFLDLCEASTNQPATAVLDEESNRIIFNVCDNDALAAWMDNVMLGEVI